MVGRLRPLVVAVCVACLGACVGEPSLDARVRADDAIARGDWARAVEIFVRNESLERDLIELVERLTTERVVLPVAIENDLMDWLESRGRMELLRAVLTQSSVDIPSGWVRIGTEYGKPDERPVHDVWLSGYRIDRHEVTNLEFAPYAGEVEAWPPHWNGNRPPASIARHPVLGVSWATASGFCERNGGRLPTEAEWERACKGPADLAYPWGDQWDSANANVALRPLVNPTDAWEWVVPDAHDTAFGPLPVGEPAAGASPEGVCNMADNASEWIADWHAADAYLTLPALDPVGSGPEWNHVVRGGAWLFRSNDVHAARDLSRCTSRNSSHAISDPRMGFRCVYES